MDLGHLSNKSILVTGANGFIGSHLLKMLENTDAIIHAIDLDFKNATLDDSSVILHRLDLRDQETVNRIIRQIQPAHVIHLAGNTDRSRKLEKVDEIMSANLNSTINLLTALQDINYESFVLSSTCEIYGSNNNCPINEEMEPDPVSLYSLSKLLAENYCTFITRNHNKPITILRLFNVYGEGQNDTMFIPQLIKACKEKKRFKMTGGNQTRDFVYIRDVVRAFLLATKIPDPNCNIVNIGSGKSISIRNLAVSIASRIKCGDNLDIGALPYRSNEIWRIEANINKAQKVLGWLPEYPIENGIDKLLSK